MNTAKHLLCLTLGMTLCAPWVVARADGAGADAERNAWPILVERRDDQAKASGQQMFGPLVFQNDSDDGASVSGFRPLWTTERSADGKARETAVLYPLFTYRANGARWKWSVLNLFNRSSPTPAGDKDEPRTFDLWPVYFSRDTGSPATSYHAVFPLYGRVKDRFLNDRVDWVLFPLYGRFQQDEKVVYTAPWPFVRVIRGGDNHGWAVWPLAGAREKTGQSRSQYALWPLLYRDETGLDTPTPTVKEGFLPFYARDRGPGFRSEAYLWPFFGYLDRQGPKSYHETRYFWPFFVQGRGVTTYRNRWAPFYTHSIVKGTDKTWIAWPLWQQRRWTDAGLAQTKTQFLFFVYWSLEEKRAGAPAGAPTASKTHLWPLYSAWDNGAGRRQVQLLSPLEPLFQGNREIRLAYSPLFALYRYDQRAPGQERYSFLWNAVSYQSDLRRGTAEFHLGPLWGTHRTPESRRYDLLGGLLSFRRDVSGPWRVRFADFARAQSRPTS